MNNTDKFTGIKAVFLDMDGTIYHGSTLYPTTIPFINFLEEHHIRYAYCSNNTSYSKQQYVERLAKFGLSASEKNFYTATDFLVDTLKKEHPEWKRLFLLGMPAMADELRSHGYEIVDDDPEAVIVSFDKLLCYERLCKAAYFVREKSPASPRIRISSVPAISPLVWWIAERSPAVWNWQAACNCGNWANRMPDFSAAPPADSRLMRQKR